MTRKTVELAFTIGVAVAALTGAASAQNSPVSAALDSSLRGAVEAKDVPGVPPRPRMVWTAFFPSTMADAMRHRLTREVWAVEISEISSDGFIVGGLLRTFPDN